VSEIIHAVVKYVTNHIVSRIPSYTVRYAWYRHVLGWTIGPRASILMGQYIDFGKLRGRGKPVIIGAGAIINRGCFLQTFGGLAIGENASISTGVSLVTGTHDMSAVDFAEVRKPIVIGHHVWIGTNAVVLGGVTVGEGAIICAGSVIRTPVRAGAVVDGVPGKVVGRRPLENPAYAINFRPLFE
jgi:acetyltransferase-like isoleucine patch superfamily enzyme